MPTQTTTYLYSNKFSISLNYTKKSPIYKGDPPGEWLDRLDGSYQPSSGAGDRGSFFTINLNDAVELRDLLDEYIEYKKKEKGED